MERFVISTCKLSSRIEVEVKKDGKMFNARIGGTSISVRELLSNPAGMRSQQMIPNPE